MPEITPDPTSWWDHIDKIVVLLGVLGGGVVWVWTQFKASKKEQSDREDELEQKEASYVAKLEARNEQLLLENASLNRQVLQARLDQVAAGSPPSEVLKTIIEACPKLMWAKKKVGDQQYVYVAVSYSFAALYFGGPPKAYIGKDPEAFIPQEIHKVMLDLDELCLKTQAPVTLHQRLYGMPTKVEGTIDGYKFCIRLNDGFDYIVGIADHYPDAPTK